MMLNNCTPISRQHLYGSLDNFQIEKQIGQGQFSQVFKAKCLVDQRVVALKRMKIYELMDQKAREECYKEIELLKVAYLIFIQTVYYLKIDNLIFFKFFSNLIIRMLFNTYLHLLTTTIFI